MSRPLVTIVAPYATRPLRGGGPIRIAWLGAALAEQYRVWQYSQCVSREQFLARPFVARRYSHSANYHELAGASPLAVLLFYLSQRRLSLPPLWQDPVLAASFPPSLRRRLAEAQVVEVEHPWQFRPVYRYRRPGQPLVFSTQNVEIDAYSADVLRLPAALVETARLLIERIEHFAVAHADAIICVSQADARRLAERYGPINAPIMTIPNGVDCGRFRPPTPQERLAARAQLGLDGRPAVVFSGSSHGPNIAAAAWLVELARAEPTLQVLIAGGVGDMIARAALPNLRITGRVADLTPYYHAADIAVSPITAGSGTSLKMLEYMAFGLPVASTPFGARGFDLEDGHHALLGPLAALPGLLRRLAADGELRERLAAQGRALVVEHYDWAVIGRRLRQAYAELLGERSGAKGTAHPAR